jgi:DNA-binding response OmpR family regulator
MPRKVLLVDTDPTLASELEAAFAAHDFLIDHAADAESALVLIEEFAYAVLMIDLLLPNRSGVELLRDLRARSIDVPVAVVTAYLPEGARELLAGFPNVKLVVPKPVEPAALAALVAAAATPR